VLLWLQGCGMNDVLPAFGQLGSYVGRLATREVGVGTGIPHGQSRPLCHLV
jgi:hypothetical protein